ncbi:DUF2752 domain-containing protein [Aeromicrobium sp. 636]|uniref:DUF2752 domain-containing protein n=1 Tax=Aeromicrobium senzhongii TaxID=2663859 RepID=A0A8I0ESL5_9ACTN|nr:DUF2752 domain-containing protein [Aeromicrobium senzhongii]MBC9224794.1 DUF2752 domain-containing protein [Aeromicrobium senzhongii]MCQ3996907.1 DUF2752 domain-containing protein [Aeromicrobium sp. 636]MTB86841.1 DUF2752 domain-containing protein [Aeromicrobium senzhongii]QNL93320.1 DUF2752 domain-containing protein [Aeromicrobium senzhongii]
MATPRRRASDLSDVSARPVAAGISRRRGAFAFSAVTLAGLAAIAVVAARSPEESGHYPTCPFLAVTGLFCPGCGSLRALHALAHGDLATAWDRNPLAVLLLPAVLVAWAAWGLRLLGRRAWHPSRIPAGWIWALLVVVLTYWVARNVPGWTWLSPA